MLLTIWSCYLSAEDESILKLFNTVISEKGKTLLTSLDKIKILDRFCSKVCSIFISNDLEQDVILTIWSCYLSAEDESIHKLFNSVISDKGKTLLTSLDKIKILHQLCSKICSTF